MDYNLRERAEIVNLAIKSSKTLNSQELIDFFEEKHRIPPTDDGYMNDIINVTYPKCSDNFRGNLKKMMLKYSMKQFDEETLLDYFRDFFAFHNEANKNTSAVDKYFTEWFSNRMSNQNEL